ncbi:MAG TPA: transcription elongation factor GreA [Candidatus Dormibacteraeota bacterium]|nr:transcription elongation factor GreA [Candidatus Dormibacteraeota bacterium]
MAVPDEIPITAAGRKALEDELAELVGVRRPQIVALIAHTREQGDLRENAGYHQAREDQSLVEGRIADIEETLRRAVLIDVPTHAEVVELGCTVTVADEFGESTLQLVGPTETNAASGRISASSPVGKALLGHRAGDRVKVATPGGTREMEILTVSGAGPGR